MQKLLSGVQPSGTLHIGNYLGALKQFVDLYQNYDSMFMIADYHALTSLRRPDQLRANILDVVKDYLAIGLDPKKAIIFKQSDVPEHTELAWIFNCMVSVPFLMQAHAYKDKVTKGLEANAGLFTYPMLMAADILLYDTEVVPVGQDQKQHVEYAREAASKFNLAFGATFIEPKEHIMEEVAVVPGTDGKKMSKSYGNTIPLFASDNDIRAAVMNIVTDSSGDRPENVYAIHKALKSEKELVDLYSSNKGNYKALKEALAHDISTLISPMRTVRESLTDTEVIQILKDGTDRARERAVKKMTDVRKKIGVAL